MLVLFDGLTGRIHPPGHIVFMGKQFSWPIAIGSHKCEVEL
jgi:hypothetical protein